MENEKTFGRFLISKRQENEISARQLAIALDYSAVYILRRFSLSDNHDNQYYKEKGNSKKIVSPDKEKRFSDVRCRNFVVRPFLVGLFHSRRNIV